MCLLAEIHLVNVPKYNMIGYCVLQEGTTPIIELKC